MGESALSLLGPNSAEKPCRADGKAQTGKPAHCTRHDWAEGTVRQSL